MTHVTFPKPTPRIKESKPLRSKPHKVNEKAALNTFVRDGFLCQWCLVPGGKLVPHHRLLRSQGGKDQPEHMVSVHPLCHDAIHREVAEAKRRRFIVSSEADLSMGIENDRLPESIW